MLESERERMPYPSDVSDERWNRIAGFLPPEKPRGRHRETDLRDIVDALNYRWSTGCVWRMLPHDFPAWGTVYCYFRQWLRDGTLQKLRAELLKPTPRTPLPNVTKNADPRRGPQSPAISPDPQTPNTDPRFGRAA
ncbi:MAG: transposase [Planctomycetaceae bacterium]